MDLFSNVIVAAGVGLLVITFIALVGGLIWFATTRRPAAPAGPDDPILEMIGEADAAAPVTSASWRDRNGNRGRYRRAHQWQPPAPAAPQVVLAGGQPGGGWWPVIGGGGNPPAPAGTLTVNLVTPAPAGGGAATYSVNITGAAGAVTFGMTGLPAGATWGVAPAPFAAPRGGTLIINLPAGATGRATLFAAVGGATLSYGFDLT